MKEECIAERIAITKFKAKSANNATAINHADNMGQPLKDKRSDVFEDNEFAISHHAVCVAPWDANNWKVNTKIKLSQKLLPSSIYKILL